MKKMMQKLKKNAGFTLAETLMTMLILLMVSLVVAEGIPAAVTAYGKAVDAANAQVLFSTTVNALRSELSTAKDVHFYVDPSTGSQTEDLIYVSPATESKTKLYIDSTDKTIMVQDFLKFDESGPQKDGDKDIEPRTLVSGSAQTTNLQVTYDSVNWTDKKDSLVFTGLKVTKPGNSTSIVNIAALYIRCLGVDIV